MNRIESYDILKGIGIILMIVAHTYGPESIIWNFIYAFHMPLFFIVSGMFYNQKSLPIILMKNISQLIIPYLTMCIIVIVLTQIRQPHNIKDDLELTLLGLGPGWFFLAMFLTRILFHSLLYHFPNYYLIVTFIISMVVCILAHNIRLFYIFSFIPALVSLFFFSFGYFAKQKQLLTITNKYSYTFILIGGGLWLTTSLFGKVELSQCIFKLSIIDFAGSIGGTFIFYKLSQTISKTNSPIKTILSDAGRYSLVILFFHSIDYCIYPWYLITPHIPPLLQIHTIVILRLLFVFMCVIITINSKWLRYFFRITIPTK